MASTLFDFILIINILTGKRTWGGGGGVGGGGVSGETAKRFLYVKAGGMIGTGKRIDGMLERIPLRRRERKERRKEVRFGMHSSKYIKTVQRSFVRG